MTEAILKGYRFITIVPPESGEILYYDNGVYVKGGEVIINQTAEDLYGYELANRHLAEIKGHIIRRTYRNRKELDADINIINLKNGLYNIVTGKLRMHTPEYISITQMPIKYNPNVKPKLFGLYLQQVLYPTEIRTAIELMAYTLYRDNPYEIIVKLFGYGANGKGVFTGILTALVGYENVSNVPLSAMLKNHFALSDLENKYINIDNELPSTTIYDTTVLKKLTGRQPIRIERKNKDAYDVRLYAKLIFSTNKIPETADESDAYFRREVIIGFPNRFEGKADDSNLIRKLTTEEELAGIFNILVRALRRVLDRGIFVREKTIEERREKHQLAVNPIGCFLQVAIAPDSVVDRTTKDDLYEAYKRFCSIHNLAVESKINFGRIIKSLGYQEYREPSGKRRTMWEGIKLAEEYCLDAGQQQLTGIGSESAAEDRR